MKEEKIEVIAYWKMGKDLCVQVLNDYRNKDRIIEAVKRIEDNPEYPYVGRFSYPNEDGFLELDAAYMEGNGKVGSIIGAHHIVNPIEVARSLSDFNENIVLSSNGADRYAKKEGFKTKEVLEIRDENPAIKSHDTFGVIQLVDGHFVLAITTSGRKGKALGRVGDSPLVGSGFYCEDGVGACVATGDGEACLRNVMAKEAVDRLMLGEPLEGICGRVLERGLKKLNYTTELSLLAVDKDGHYDVSSTFEIFPYSFIHDGKIENRYLYKGEEHDQNDGQFVKLYHGD